MADFCAEPFRNLFLKNDGTLKQSACSVMRPWEVDKIDFSNDPKLNEIRRKWLAGEWPDECGFCKRIEDNGLVSRRQPHREENPTPVLVALDYWAGNTCNLRCAICGPDASIAWQKELGIDKNNRTILTNYSWQDLDLTNLNWVHFTGGEPMLIPEHIELLKAIPEKGGVHLFYNTNAAVRPTPELVALWAQFEYVHLAFSIDDIGERLEYQRYPVKWSSIVENLYWYRATMPSTVGFGINLVESIFNRGRTELEDWIIENFPTNRDGLAVQVYRQLANRTPVAIDGDPMVAIEYLNQLDKRRGTDWRATFPELANQLDILSK